MNKRQLVVRVHRHMGAGATRETALEAVNAVLSSILKATAKGPKVHIPRLGTFEYIDFDGCRRLTFRPAEHLIQATVGTCHATPATPRQ